MFVGCNAADHQLRTETFRFHCCPPPYVIQSRPYTDGPREESPCGRKCCMDTPPAFEVRCRLRGEILPAVGRRKRTACGHQDDTRGAGRIALNYLNRPPPYVIQSRPHTDGPREESPCGRKCCRAENNHPVGGNTAFQARISPSALRSAFCTPLPIVQ